MFWLGTLLVSHACGFDLETNGHVRSSIYEIGAKYFGNRVVFVINQSAQKYQKEISLLPSHHRQFHWPEILPFQDWNIFIYNRLPTLRRRRYFGKKENFIWLLDLHSNVTNISKTILYYNMLTPSSKIVALFIESVSQERITETLEVVWKVLKALHTVVVSVTDRSVQFHSYYPYHTAVPGPQMVLLVDAFQDGRFLNKCSVFSNKLPSSFIKNVLIMAVYPRPPYVLDWTSVETEKRGVEPLMFRTIADNLGFELKTLPPPVVFSGSSPKTAFENDEVVGIPGMLYRHEADINVGGNKPAPSQILINDILFPHFDDHLVWLIPRLGYSFHWSSLVVFGAIEWSLAVTSIFLCALALSLILESSSWFLCTYGALLEQGFGNCPKSTPSRLIIGSYSFFGIIFTTAYRSFLYSVLTSKSEVKMFTNPDEVLEAGWMIYFVPAGKEVFNTTHHDFWNAALAPNRQMWNMNLTYNVESIISSKKGMTLIIYNCAKYIMNRHFLDTSGREEAIMIERYIPYLVTAFVAPGHPLTYILERKIHQLIDGGFLYHWMSNQLFSAKIQQLFRDPPKKMGFSTPLTSSQLMAPFVLLIFFLLVSFGIFLVEICVCWLKRVVFVPTMPSVPVYSKWSCAKRRQRMSPFHKVLRCRCAISNVSKGVLTRNFRLSFVPFLPKTVPYILSDIGEGIVDVTVKEWYVKEGDKVSQFDPVCEVQSDKASVTITSRFDGEVGRLRYQVDEIAKVGAPLLDIVVPDDSNIDVATDTSVTPLQDHQVKADAYIVEDDVNYQKPLATPAVRRIAKENQVDLQKVKPTGKGGRVMKEDILLHLGMLPSQGVSSMVKKSVPQANADKVEEITGVKKAMAKVMAKAWLIPHFTYAEEVDVSVLVGMKSEIQRLEKEHQVRLTYLPFMLKAVSQALIRYPRLNSEVDDSCNTQTVRSSHNLGVAVDSPIGLLVPSIKNVQDMNVVDIAKELNRLILLAKEGRLTSQDLAGGTFTVSNIGSIGGTVATPIILPPQVAIIALGKVQRLPRFDAKGAVSAVDILTLSCSADHRVIDGAYVARFLNLFKLYISSPKLLLQL